MNIKIEAQMTVSVMYNYLLQHTYTSLSGISSVFIGIVCIAWGLDEIMRGAMTQQSSAVLALGVVFLLGTPIILWNKARKQVKRTAFFHKPICYELNEEGIIVSQDDQESRMPWDAVMKVTATGTSVIIYFSRVRAIILPKKDMTDSYAKVVEMLYSHVETQKVKIRTVS